jgi:GNAT superfamily N-acetyltransferase
LCPKIRKNSNLMNPSHLDCHATPSQLEQAAALNHTGLFVLEALAQGGSVRQSTGLTWTHGGINGWSIIAFPALDEEDIGETLNKIVDDYLLHPPKGAGCWSLDPPQTEDLGVRLLARGFQPGWRPCWMALELKSGSPVFDRPDKRDYSMPGGLVIKADNTSLLAEVKNLPYANITVPPASLQEQGGNWQRFVATLHGKVVAHSVVFLTTGALGVAGIYAVGVVPRFQRKGIGKAMTLAACQYARERGYHYAVLNATPAGRRMYERLKFDRVGDGWTWWLAVDRLLADPPTKRQVALAEAVGKGDVRALEGFHFQNWEDPDKPLTNGLTLMQLAALCQQPASGEWLLAAGASLAIPDAWDLGWKERAGSLLHKHPELVNRLYTDQDKTLLHIAVERNDKELTQLALSARPDLSIKDKIYQSTPLGWATHFGHDELIRLLQAQ